MTKKDIQFYEKPDITDVDFPIRIKSIYSDESTDIFFNVHWHKEIEFFYITSGKAIIYCDFNPITVSEGDFVVVNSNQLHQGQNLSNRLGRYNIIVDPDLFYTGFKSRCETKYIYPIMQNYILFKNKISDDKEIGNLIQKLIKEYEMQENGFELMIKGYLYELFGLLVRRHVVSYITPREYEKRLQQLKRFDRVFRYVEENYSQKITLTEAADMANMSRSHFCRSFKELTGKTFIEYVNFIRLNRAELFLSNSNMSVTEIAMCVGFNDINYFSRLFKQYKGMPPSDVRTI